MNFMEWQLKLSSNYQYYLRKIERNQDYLDGFSHMGKRAALSILFKPGIFIIILHNLEL